MQKNKLQMYEKGIKTLSYDSFVNENGSFDMLSYEKYVASHIQSGGALLGSDGAFTFLIKRIIERAMEAELSAHLSIEGDPENRRNGEVSKELRTVAGPISIKRSRDRKGTFTPQLVKKWSRELSSDLHEQILYLYSQGSSYSDIESFVRSMYGVSVSEHVIQQVVASIDEELQAWKSRDLERLYPAIWIDGVYYKVRAAGTTRKEVLYNVLGVDMEGNREVLGMYSFPGGESSKHWLRVLTDLKNRGVEDVLFIMSDNLKGITQSVEAALPMAKHQLCIVHQIRQSFQYISWKNAREVISDMKCIYQASTLDNAQEALKKFETRWQEKYPDVVNSWKNNWEHLSVYFDYGAEIRKLIYTTNFIENYNRQLRKVTKGKGAFPSEQALLRQVYLAHKHIIQKWKGPIKGWKMILAQLRISFDDRIRPEDLN